MAIRRSAFITRITLLLSLLVAMPAWAENYHDDDGHPGRQRAAGMDRAIQELAAK